MGPSPYYHTSYATFFPSPDTLDSGLDRQANNFIIRKERVFCQFQELAPLRQNDLPLYMLQ